MTTEDAEIILCKNEIRGNPNNLIQFLSRHGQDVVAIIDDGIIMKGMKHYIVSKNTGCPGCDKCKKRDD